MSLQESLKHLFSISPCEPVGRSHRRPLLAHRSARPETREGSGLRALRSRFTPTRRRPAETEHSTPGASFRHLDVGQYVTATRVDPSHSPTRALPWFPCYLVRTLSSSSPATASVAVHAYTSQDPLSTVSRRPLYPRRSARDGLPHPPTAGSRAARQEPPRSLPRTRRSSQRR